MDLKFFTKSNEELIDSLKQTAELIEYQERTIKELREKLSQEKEYLLRSALGEEYAYMKADLERYRQKCQEAAFFFSPKEKLDFEDFERHHCYMDGDKEKICLFQLCSNKTIYYYNPSMHGSSIEVECPYCHTRRKLGTGHDVIVEENGSSDA